MPSANPKCSKSRPLLFIPLPDSLFTTEIPFVRLLITLLTLLFNELGLLPAKIIKVSKSICNPSSHSVSGGSLVTCDPLLNDESLGRLTPNLLYPLRLSIKKK